MLVQALLIGLWAGILGIEMFNGLFHFHRPIFAGIIVGVILGDVQTGIIAGATFELFFAGMVPLAGAQPPNVVIAGIIGTAFAIITKQSAEVSLGIALPFGLAVQAAITFLFTIFSGFMKKADKAAEEADPKGIAKVNYIALLSLFSFYFVVAFLPIYLGADSAKGLVDVLNSTAAGKLIIGGLGVAGAMMPAVGFATLLKIMLKKQYAAFLIIGFMLSAYGKLDILPIALIGGAIAAYDYFLNEKKGNVTKKEVPSRGI